MFGGGEGQGEGESKEQPVFLQREKKKSKDNKMTTCPSWVTTEGILNFCGINQYLIEDTSRPRKLSHSWYSSTPLSYLKHFISRENSD